MPEVEKGEGEKSFKHLSKILLKPAPRRFSDCKTQPNSKLLLKRRVNCGIRSLKDFFLPLHTNKQK